MLFNNYIGVTERGDAGLDHSWANFSGPKILITKNPGRLPLDKIDPDQTIIHCTITGHGGSPLEPNVPIWGETIAVYKDLSKKFHTVLRVDPIITTPHGVVTALEVLSHAKGRVRISFIDAYPHVRKRISDMCGNNQDLIYKYGLWWEGVHAPIEVRREIYTAMNKIHPTGIEICGEPEMACTGCVSQIDLDIFGVSPMIRSGRQRSYCACLGNKVELLKNRSQCFHGCVYCYWK